MVYFLLAYLLVGLALVVATKRNTYFDFAEIVGLTVVVIAWPIIIGMGAWVYFTRKR